ncbi:inositol phospholipid synthesis and fat-storage-inducing TM-domain-containing protein [Xylariomycetidae sp. FL0641]|nr:inositol phospholipid synthesis and fat-storage-inducing TM-domain-containing protein [Xylariomycetidae sp. FL0641]
MADTYSLRSRPVKMAASDEAHGPTSPTANKTIPEYSSPSSSSSSSKTTGKNARRNPPLLPTPLERAILLTYPVLLGFGALFSVLSPQTRAAPYDVTGHAHVQGDIAPSYFAQKSNLFNILFVKRGWAWISAAFSVFALAHPAVGKGSGGGGRQLKAALRWVLVTTWWFLVTQWCFGPPIIDRGFRFTGGKCEVATEAVAEGVADKAEVLTAAACRAAGGRWSGGHDISGHVFLLVLGSFFLVQEAGWVVLPALTSGRYTDDRTIVMPDGAVKSARVEREKDSEGSPETVSMGVPGKFASAVVGLCGWMLLMTAIYFHTWFEKLTGLVVASMAIYPIYILPRAIPALRDVIGLPGI